MSESIPISPNEEARLKKGFKKIVLNNFGHMFSGLRLDIANNVVDEIVDELINEVKKTELRV